MSTIVVVNDEPNAFAHGPEALTAISAEPADLITDGSNHPMPGVELVRQLRHLSDVPVVFLSAWAQELREELRGTELEAQGYIDLPFSTDQLLEGVKTAMTHRRGRE